MPRVKRQQGLFQKAGRAKGSSLTEKPSSTFSRSSVTVRCRDGQALKERTELSDDCRSEIREALQGRMQQDKFKRKRGGGKKAREAVRALGFWADPFFSSSRSRYSHRGFSHDLVRVGGTKGESPAVKEGEEVAEEADDEAEEHVRWWR